MMREDISSEIQTINIGNGHVVTALQKINTRNKLQQDRFLVIPTDKTFTLKTLERLYKQVNEDLTNKLSNETLSISGAVSAIAYTNGSNLLTAHAGDTRVTLILHEANTEYPIGIETLTNDHILGNTSEQLRLNLSAEQVKDHKHGITRCFGNRSSQTIIPDAETGNFTDMIAEIENSDLYLVIESDGCYLNDKILPERKRSKLLAAALKDVPKQDVPQHIVTHFFNVAREKGCPDDFTCVVTPLNRNKTPGHLIWVGDGNGPDGHKVANAVAELTEQYIEQFTP